MGRYQWMTSNVLVKIDILGKKIGLLTTQMPFEFYQTVIKFVPATKSVCLAEEDILKSSKDMERESKSVPKIFHIHKAESYEVRVIYYDTLYNLAADKIAFYT